MSDDEIIAVVTAHKEGKQIQCRNKLYVIQFPDTTWHDKPKDYDFDFNTFDYRVKSEREPREWTIGLTAWGDFTTEVQLTDESIRVREVIEE